MNYKQLLFATLGAFVTFFVLNFLWYQFVMGSFYEANYGLNSSIRTPPLMGGFMISYLISGLVMAYMFPKWSRGYYSLKQGAIFGLLAGALANLSMNIQTFSILDVMTPKVLIVDSLYGLAMMAIVGIVIALIYQKMTPAS